MATSRSKARMNERVWNSTKHTGNRPESAHTVVDHMRDLHAAGYFSEQLELAEKYPELKDLPEVRNVCGLSELGLDRDNNALADFESAAKEYSRRLAGTYGNMIATLLKNQNYSRAEEVALKARTLEPFWIVTHLNLMGVYSRLKQHEDIITAILKMEELIPDWQDNVELWQLLDIDIDLREVKKILNTRLNKQGS